MRKIVFFLFYVVIYQTTLYGQWHYVRTLPLIPGNYTVPVTYHFHDVAYATDKMGMYTTSVTRNEGPPFSVLTFYSINENNNVIQEIYNGNGQGLSTYFLFSLKKYGLVYQIGNYQGFPFYSVMDQDGNYTNIGTITDGFTSCFTATDPDHYYAIIEPQSSFHGLILGARFNNQVHLLDSFTTFIPTKIDFPSYYNGYMSIVEKADNTHKLLRSTDSISGWVTVYNSPLSEINDFQFYDDTIGYAIIGHQKVIRTLNGGEYWDTIYQNSGQIINKLDIINDSIVFFCGDTGLLMRSSNRGDTWIQENTNATINFNKIFMFSTDRGYLFSNRTCYSNFITIDMETFSVPKMILRPNPTYGEINISADFPIKTVEIIDLGGKIIYTKEMDDKEVIIHFFPDGVGIYFIRATFFNGQKRTEKIVFVR